VRSIDVDRGADATRAAVNVALAPWGGAEACLDRYEAGIRLASDLQLTIAKVSRLEPIGWLASTSAGMTRDVGAAQLSVARWFLDG
jgi:hypothetical protein